MIVIIKKCLYPGLLLLGLAMGACSSSGNNCSTNNDCAEGEICTHGKCRVSDFGNNTDPLSSDNDTGTGTRDTNSTPIDSDSETSDSDSLGDTDSYTDLDTGLDTGCATNAECNDNKACTNDWCDQATWSCQNVPVVGHPTCASDGLYCTGVEKCYDGECVGVPPCDDMTVDTDANGNSCALVTGFVCDEDADKCVAQSTPKDDGDPCSESQFCLGDATKVCQGGICVNPIGATNPCMDGATDCMMSTCSETTDSCVQQPINVYDVCLQDRNACYQGFCSPTGSCDYSDPCLQNMNNPCVLEYCENPGSTVGDYSCHRSNEPNNSRCASGTDLCIGSDGDSRGYCWTTNELANCIQPENRPCLDLDVQTLCQPLSSCNNAAGGCQEISDPVVVTVACDQTYTFSNADFLTRHLYEYGTMCSGGDYRGMELALTLGGEWFTSSDLPVTVTVSNDSPNQVFQVMHVTDACDASTCIGAGTDSLAVTANLGDVFVLEAEPGYPPTALEVTISCN